MSVQSNYNDSVLNQYNMSTIQVRIDEKIKKQSQKILDEIGMDLSGAIKIYLKQIIIKEGLPFKVLTENGFTKEFEKETLEAYKMAKTKKDLVGPFEENKAVDYLKDLIKKKK